jgi:parallel beta-helix repeat protein
LAPFEVEHRRFVSADRLVKDVSITGFQVRGFSGENIAVVGAQDARVADNRLANGENYGFLTVGSNNTRVTGNTVDSSDRLRFIGICMNNEDGVRVSNNHITGYNVALCVQTHKAEVRNNEANDNCIGVFVDPGIEGARIQGNRIGATNPLCSQNSAFGVYGIIVYGAENTQVQHNRIEGQTSAAGGVGILVADDAATAAIATGNVISKNNLRNNDIDLVRASEKDGNVFFRNKCTSSDPVELCS